mmetsp:Transcript_15790/g.34181  ORF Transcript_15790/g.34181 Transcript_15790/m.34181 type:complete len:1143 (-) Transcript_15790:99-3527(-)
MRSGKTNSTTITRTTTSVRRSTTIRQTNATRAAGGAAEGSSDDEYPVALMDSNRGMDKSPARPSSAEAARAARRNRIASSPSSGGGGTSVSPVRKSAASATIIAGSGNDSGTTTTAMSTSSSSATAGRARRREARSAGSGQGKNQRVVASSRSSSSAAPTGAGGGTGGGRAGRTPSPSPADLAAAFDDLAPPPPPPPRSGSASTGRRVAAGGGPGSRRSGNTVASSSSVAATSQGGTTGTNASGAGSISTAAADDADLSPEAVAKEFVMKRQHQQRDQGAARGVDKADTSIAVSSSAAAAAAGMNGHGPNKTPTISDNATEEAMAREVSPARSRNAAAVRNYVSGRAQSPPSARQEAGTNGGTVRSTMNASGTAAGAKGGADNATTSTSSPTFASGTTNTRYTSTTRNALQKKKQLQIDTSRRARGGRRGDSSRAGVGVSSPASSSAAASPGTHVGSIGSSSLGSLASPSSPDSLAYSNTHSFSKSSRSTGGGGDLLSGKATNDIPSPERGTSRRTQQERIKGRIESTQQRMMTAHTSRAPDTVYSFADGTDDGTNTESMASRYDDLSKMSSRYNRHDPLMAPVDEAVGANPNGTSVSYDSYENDNATAIEYGPASESGGGASVGGTSQGGVSQSFSPGLGVSFSPSQVTGAGGQYALEDEDNHSQLTDDRSWSRSVNLRQQHLRGRAGGANDDDQSSVMNGGRYPDSSSNRKQEGSDKNDRSSKNSNGDEGLTDWALNADDWKHFTEQVDQPQVKGALGASAAVVAGAAIFGPVGVLVGAAAVGIGVGVMQIPEEQRDTLKERATSAAHQTYESAQIAADAMGTSCATACAESGVAEKIDPKLAKFCADGAQNGCGATIVDSDLINNNPCAHTEGAVDGKAGADETGAGAIGATREAGSRHGAAISDGQHGGINTASGDESGNGEQLPKRRRKVACMRKGRIIPVGQIHSLEPSRQPRAWLDVMASINTTRDEKDEAMEELMILIKDKNTAHNLLEDGVLDSLIFIADAFFRAHRVNMARDSPDGTVPSHIQSSPEFTHAKKAANCCVNLGKAHCAIVHTEGDLLLMSAYSNGAVPIERQLAQMLYEIPHYTSVPATLDNDVTPEGDIIGNYVFTLTEISLHHAELQAKSILALSQGRIII